MTGVISHFETTFPSDDDIESLTRVVLTSPTEWDPSSSTFSSAEERYIPRNLSALYSRLPVVPTELPPLVHTLDLFDDDVLHHRLVAGVCTSPTDLNGNGFVDNLDPDVFADADIRRGVCALSAKDKQRILTPEILSKRWMIGLQTAKETLAVTTHEGIRDVYVSAEQKMRKKAPYLRFPNLKSTFYVDSLFSTVKSVHGHTGGSIFTNGYGYDRFYPWTRKFHHPDALMSFIHEVGLPNTLVSDGALEETQGRAGDICREYHIQQKVTVPYSPWQNLAEASIRELKKCVRRIHRQTGAPISLWTYSASWSASVRRLTASSIPRLGGRVPEEALTGSTPDISALALFDWYQAVYYWTPTAGFPEDKKLLGRFLGLADSCVDELAYNILTDSCKIIIRKSVWALTEDELKNPAVIERLQHMDDAIKSKLGPSSSPVEVELPERDIFSTIDDEAEATVESTEPTPENLDEFIGADVLLPQGGVNVRARVVKRVRDGDGNLQGIRNDNPILDSRTYELEFADGSMAQYAANVVAENLYSQVDPEGRRFDVFQDIVDHRFTGEITETTYVDRKGVTRNKQTTKGCELQVQWVDGTTSWLPLSLIKSSNPIQAAEYAVANKVAEEPRFSWWVRDTLRNRDRIIKRVKTRYEKRTHKHGIELPKSVRQALEIDARTGTTFWRDAIQKEMTNVNPAFEFRDDDKIPIGYTKIDCHMIFDIKSDLTRKARLVAGGHMTEVPKDSVYSSVVARDSVRLAFMVAALNGLLVLAGDVQNAYLNAPTSEKCYTIAGPEFGPAFAGRPVLIVRALYGLRSSGARWRDHIAATLREMGFVGCLADQDVYMRPNVKPCGTPYWEYVLVYVDDVLVVSHAPQLVMDDLGRRYTLKAGSVKEPDEYLGATISKFTVPNTDGSSTHNECWSMSCDLYVKRAVADVERALADIGQYLKNRVSTPLADKYRPEVDVTALLDDRRANYFQGLIGVLRWICELGRVDILTPVALLSRFLAAPREGHLEAAFHIFAYLKKYGHRKLVFDPATPVYDEKRFVKADWSQFYPGAAEALPPNMPEPRGIAVETTCYVDADHAGCQATRRSHTGIMIFVQKAPIIWYSKRQNTIETSTFGSEFIAMKIAIEQVEALRYKLRMMGIPIAGPCNVFCDNRSVFDNSTKPESVCNKKHNSIAYHRTREAQAAGTVRLAWESGETNCSDLFTKLLPGPRLQTITGMILY